MIIKLDASERTTARIYYAKMIQYTTSKVWPIVGYSSILDYESFDIWNISY